MKWFNNLRGGLSKTSSKISEGITTIFARGKLDEQALEEMEELLIKADVGVAAASQIIENLRQEKFPADIDALSVKEVVSRQITEIIKPLAIGAESGSSQRPEVFLICGVNGNGKTTTIAKLARRFKQENKQVMVAACDTFRAAATTQLEVWAQKIGCEFIKGIDKAEPASLAYQALEKAREKKLDILLIDTAGRLHNQANLMEELAKCKRVMQKIDKDVPQHTILVLDATTGQNALNQIEIFHNTVSITELILTKLDGSARGGIIVALAQKYKIPIYAIGVGEKAEDLQHFAPEEVARALMGLA